MPDTFIHAFAGILVLAVSDPEAPRRRARARTFHASLLPGCGHTEVMFCRASSILLPLATALSQNATRAHNLLNALLRGFHRTSL